MSANVALRPEPLTEAERLGEEIAETHLNQPENSGNTADRYQVVVHANRESATRSAAFFRLLVFFPSEL